MYRYQNVNVCIFVLWAPPGPYAEEVENVAERCSTKVIKECSNLKFL